jgi:hypothetical protein
MTSTQQPEQEGAPQSWADRISQKLVIALILLIGISVIALLVGATVMAYRQEQQSDLVKSVLPAGRVLAVSLHGGLWTRSLVETDTGYFSLCGGVSLLKGQSLLIEERGNSDRFLCDAQHHCTRLL